MQFSAAVTVRNCFFALALVASVASAETLVRLDASDGPDQLVQINLPLPLADKLLALVASDHSCLFCDDDSSLSRHQLTRILEAVGTAASGESVTIKVGLDRFLAHTEDSLLTIDHTRSWWRSRGSRVELPVAVAQAMAQGSGSGLDLRAGLRALALEEPGKREVVASEREGDGRLRLWIEQQP